MQNQVLTRAFRISEMLKVYNAPIRQAQKIHGILSISLTMNRQEFLLIFNDLISQGKVKPGEPGNRTALGLEFRL
jgi:hypothetical protein